MNSKMLVQLSVDDLRAIVAGAVAEAVEALPSFEAPPEVMTRAEAAEFLRCSLATLDRLTRDGGLPFHKLGDARRFRRSELLAYLSQDAHQLAQAAE